jgi:phosphomannomutase
VRGADFARAIAELFLAYDYTVYLFDEPAPFPEVTFAVPDATVKADLGVFISASNNDYRYSGYKLCTGTGSQLNAKDRDRVITEFIHPATFTDVRRRPLTEATPDELVFLGGAEPLPGCNYFRSKLRNLHGRHIDHTKHLLVDPQSVAAWQADPATALKIGYCAFHGAGRRAVPRLLHDLGLGEVTPVTGNHLDDLNGLFPCFRSDPGHEQQPDPGDPASAAIALEALRTQVGSEAFEQIDVVVGTDPDADRCGVVVRVPPEQQDIYGGSHYLLPADDMWTLLLWYRLHKDLERHGTVPEADRKFIVLGHTTSEAIVRLARKHGIGVVKSWVGFPSLVAAIERVWHQEDIALVAGLVDGWSQASQDHTDRERRSAGKRQALLSHGLICECYEMNNRKRAVNIGAMERSNGFTILGGKPIDEHSLGVNGHVRDKDGTLAALLAAEVAAYAKAQGTCLIGLLDREIYADPAVGLIVTGYQPDPPEGEYPGLAGDKIKKDRLRRALGLVQLALAGDVEIAGMRVVNTAIYRTGRYDHLYPPTLDYFYPDEGVRFYLSEDRLNHVTVRPSGTGNALRFHVQLHETPDAATLLDAKRRLFARSREVIRGLRRLLKAE